MARRHTSRCVLTLWIKSTEIITLAQAMALYGRVGVTESPSAVAGIRPMSTAIHLSGPVLVGGALLLGLTTLLIASKPVIGATIPPDVASLLFGSAAMLLLSLPAMYVVQADAAGALGLVAHTLLFVGLLLLVLVAATPLLQPSVNGTNSASIPSSSSSASRSPSDSC